LANANYSLGDGSVVCVLALDEAMQMARAIVAAFVTSIFWIVLIMIGGVRAEESRTFRNERGQVTGQATTRGDTTTYSNEKGQITGRAERRGNTTNFFNEKGQIGSSRGR
jgi:hypothetical protein